MARTANRGPASLAHPAGDHADFTDAYHYNDSDTNGSQSDWVAGEQSYGITSASFSGHPSSSTDSTATVAVDSLQTSDQSNRCQSWNGEYQMVNENGDSLIDNAKITRQPF
jgi:hypothetical protein